MKGKDPAFLFYSKDFYEGTRTMLPEERACYIDLMIYQHQHEFIPDDFKRICLYCNGISEETIKEVLKAKFKLCLKGWYNETMQEVINERKTFSEHQSINGTVGQFFKKAKMILTKNEYIKLKIITSELTNKEIFDLISGKEINKAMLEAMLIAKLKHLEDANANANANEDNYLNKEDKKTWRNDFETYLSGIRIAYEKLANNKEWVIKQEKFHPKVDILLSLEKACSNYWATEAGWKKKKSSRSVNLDWEATLTNALDFNKVYS